MIHFYSTSKGTSIMRFHENVLHGYLRFFFIDVEIQIIINFEIFTIVQQILTQIQKRMLYTSRTKSNHLYTFI